ncbi:MAG: prolipoprotein diacylglyceryl transferase [Chthoniobacterales bacterium]
MIAYWVHNLDPFAVQFGGGFGVRWYGLAYLAAFAAAYFVYVSLARRGFSVIPADKVGDFITGCAVFGVLIGGRLGEMIFYNFTGFLQDPLVFFRVWEGGMSAHGGILGVMLYTLWYAWRHGVNWPGLGDNLVVGVPLGLFFGRVANFINGELFGRPSEAAWAVKFPKEIYEAPVETQRAVLEQAQEMFAGPVGLDEVVSAVPGSAELTVMLGEFLTPRHPSQIYEALLEGLLLFGLLWLVRVKARTPNGVITGLFFVGYAVTRSVAEFFRSPDAGYVGWLTKGQFLSVFVLLIGVGFLVAAWRRPVYPAAWAKRG